MEGDREGWRRGREGPKAGSDGGQGVAGEGGKEEGGGLQDLCSELTELTDLLSY